MRKRKSIKLFLQLLTITSLFISMSFSFDKIGIHWFWESNPVVSLVFLFIGLITGYFWLRLVMNLSNGDDQ